MVVKTALELDLFSTVGKGHHTLESISAATQCSERGMRILLDALCPLGLLSKSGNEYTLAPTAEAFLVRGKPSYCADTYLTWWQNRNRMIENLKTGTASLDLSGPDAGEFWANYTAQELVTWPQIAEKARQNWETLEVDRETMPGLHILDVACGSGAKSFVLAQDDPGVHVTALDLPQVVEVSAKVAEVMRVAQQVSFLPGNMMTTQLPSNQFDIVRFGAILYYFNPDQVKVVLHKAHGALRPNGLVVIGTLVADEERCRSEMALLGAVELFNVAPHSHVYSFSEYKAFLEATGFSEVLCHTDTQISAMRL
jgi:2-polyprenyl-3-methyl-5-hydroxy-6-metoxy-1,4-benzoquinol methylase